MSSDNDIVLSVKNVSKCFEMYEKPVHRLYQTLCAGRKKFYKEFWALKNISFDVHRGECVGIIGRNGAGKSTLLQVITGTLAPTAGELKVNGRIAALLELGSGFNPEFTGRENVYLNGAILGLSKEEIDRRYDDILAFADIGDFINQPVKTYSSGMMVRLAFAVNVFVDPEILIVDEALAVGDAEFQLKCAKRMRQLIDAKVTILFVSHDVNAVRAYCDKALWVADGQIKLLGDVKEVTSRYMEFLFGGDKSRQNDHNDTSEEGAVMSLVEKKCSLKRWGTGEVLIDAYSFSGEGRAVGYGELLRLSITARVLKEFRSEKGLAGAFSIRTRKAVDVVCCSSVDENEVWQGRLLPGMRCTFNFEWKNELCADEYCLIMAIEDHANPENKYVDYVENAIFFKTVQPYPIYALTRPFCRMNLKKEN